MLGSSRDYVYFFKCRGLVYLLKPSGYLTYYQALGSAHTFRIRVLFVSQNKQRRLLYTLLSDWVCVTELESTVFARVICAPAYFAHPNF